MFHHISIAANEPFRVAKVLAELTGGQFYEFPITPGAYRQRQPFNLIRVLLAISILLFVLSNRTA